MKKILILASCIALFCSAQDPNARFRRNYKLLQSVGAASSYRDAKCFMVLDKKYPDNCIFFADSTTSGTPIIWAEMHHKDGTLWFQFTISEQGSMLKDRTVYTRKQQRCARHFYQTLSKAAAQKK